MGGGGRGGIFNLATHEKMTKRLLSTACHMDDELFLFRPTVGLSNQLTKRPTPVLILILATILTKHPFVFAAAATAAY